MISGSGSVIEILHRREREYLLSNVRAKMKTSVENLDAGDLRIEKASEGETIEIPLWAAEALARLNLVEVPGEAFEVELVKALGREKMMGPLQLSGVSPDFYVKMKRRLETMGEGVREGKVRKEEYDRLRAGCYDIVGLRLSKLLSLSSSSTSLASLGDKLTPEEAAFFAQSQSRTGEWKAAILGGAK